MLTKSDTPRKESANCENSPEGRSPVHGRNLKLLTLEYTKYLDKMMVSSMSPLCEDWRKTIINAKPDRTKIAETPIKTSHDRKRCDQTQSWKFSGILDEDDSSCLDFP
jgi:hypothetical protein